MYLLSEISLWLLAHSSPSFPPTIPPSLPFSPILLSWPSALSLCSTDNHLVPLCVRHCILRLQHEDIITGLEALPSGEL